MNQTTSTNHFPGLSAHCFDAIAMVLHASREAPRAGNTAVCN
jgi:hypothetical protein